MKNILLFSALLFFSLSVLANEPGDNQPNTAYLGNKNGVAQYKPDPTNGGPHTAAVPTANMANSIIVSPNPATAYLDVKFDQGNEGKIEIGLYDMTGKLIMSSTEVVAGEKTIRITRDNFPAGVYFLSIKSERGQQCQKVIFS